MLTLKPSSAAFRAGAAPRPVRVQPCVASSSSVLSGLQFGERTADAGLQLVAPSSGMKWTMMRHGNKVKHLGMPADQRKALIRGLVTELIRHGAIKTTKTRAKVIRPYVEHMITLAKDGSLHARRQALAFMYDKDLVQLLFSGAQERYGDRAGGYTRIKWPSGIDGTAYRRRGDGVEMAIIELV